MEIPQYKKLISTSEIFWAINITVRLDKIIIRINFKFIFYLSIGC